MVAAYPFFSLTKWKAFTYLNCPMSTRLPCRTTIVNKPHTPNFLTGLTGKQLNARNTPMAAALRLQNCPRRCSCIEVHLYELNIVLATTFALWVETHIFSGLMVWVQRVLHRWTAWILIRNNCWWSHDDFLNYVHIVLVIVKLAVGKVLIVYCQCIHTWNNYWQESVMPIFFWHCQYLWCQ